MKQSDLYSHFMAKKLGIFNPNHSKSSESVSNGQGPSVEIDEEAAAV